MRRFLSLERSLNKKGCSKEFDAVMREYDNLKHAEAVPTPDLEKPSGTTIYLPMHAVYKHQVPQPRPEQCSMPLQSPLPESLSMTRGPTIHPPLVDVLLRFRLSPTLPCGTHS